MSNKGAAVVLERCYEIGEAYMKDCLWNWVDAYNIHKADMVEECWSFVRGYINNHLPDPLWWQPETSEVFTVLDDKDQAIEPEYDFDELWSEAMEALDEVIEENDDSIIIDGEIFPLDGFVVTSYDKVINYKAAESLMDDEIREDLHGDLAPCTDQEFYDAYCEEHKRRFGEEFEPDKPDGQW